MSDLRDKPYTLAKFKDDLLKYEIVTEDKIKGCTEEEVCEVMASQNVASLPYIYVEFLRTVGKTEIDLPFGYNLFYPSILETRQLTDTYSSWQIPKNTFIVSLESLDDESFIIYFLRVDKNLQNPRVYTTHLTKQGSKHVDIGYLFTRHLYGWIEIAKDFKLVQG